jgi:hypothetical protein
MPLPGWKSHPLWVLALFVCLIGSSGLAAAGTLAEYRLLFLGGGPVKWGSPQRGSGSIVTYALADAPRTVKGARNCGAIVPMGALLARNGISPGQFEMELDRAFQAWSAAANISFVPAAPEHADIVIGAQKTPAGRAFTNVESKAAKGKEIGTIVSSTICLNPEQAWKIGFDRNLEIYDLRYTLMHEIGHAIGLDHPGTPEALMDFRYSEAFASLQAGDRAGATALYGPAQSILAAQPAGSARGGDPDAPIDGRERALGVRNSSPAKPRP